MLGARHRPVSVTVFDLACHPSPGRATASAGAPFLGWPSHRPLRHRLALGPDPVGKKPSLEVSRVHSCPRALPGSVDGWPFGHCLSQANRGYAYSREPSSSDDVKRPMVTSPRGAYIAAGDRLRASRRTAVDRSRRNSVGAIGSRPGQWWDSSYKASIRAGYT